ncbi:MAG TPA: hypothetical protein VFB81_18450 [Myxococcales bacterium]|nr:hypothetical protein [Myxococcales bacterium]
MYVVRNKKTKAIIHMANSTPGVDLRPEEVFPGFDPKAMELGRYHEQHLPDDFTIEDGVVVAKDKPKREAEPLENLKAAKLASASRLAFELRRRLIPEHEMLNAALGVYDEKRTRQIQETVKAFREEYKRFEAALEKARTAKAVEALEPDYPTKLVS